MTAQLQRVITLREVYDDAPDRGPEPPLTAHATGGESREGAAIEGRVVNLNARRRSTGGAAQPPAPVPEGVQVFDPRDPLPIAKALVAARYTRFGARVLVHHRGDFYLWQGTHYAARSDDAMRADVYSFLEPAQRYKNGQLGPFAPNSRSVADVIEALAVTVWVEEEVDTPAWLGAAPDLAAEDIMPCLNGLLHTPTRTLLPHTPDYFNLNAVDFSFDPAAPAPARWLQFVQEDMFQGDREAADAWQETFGYLLSADTGLQKIIVLIGPKRSGKGTAARVLIGLLGRHNVIAPSLGSFSGTFGLQPMIGKRLAILGDVRLGKSVDPQSVIENLLSISGEDSLTIHRKYRDAWTGPLRLKILVMSNLLIKLADPSGALASRFIFFVLRQSFLGREDVTLTEKLLAERAGILNWALDGLGRLRARGRLIEPASSADHRQVLEALASPVGEFISDRCVVGPDLVVLKDVLFVAYQAWCQTQGKIASDKATFGRDLLAALPQVKSSKLSAPDGDRQPCYRGLALKDAT